MADRLDSPRRESRLSRRALLKNGLILGSGVLSLQLLVACSQAPAPAPTAAPPAPAAQPTRQAAAAPTAPVAAPTAAPAAASQPKRGGTLTAAAEVDPVSLDPHTNSNFSSLQAYDHIYESLVGYDVKMNVVPMLAEKWETGNDGKLYTFTLRQGVKFHDGKTMTAEDVKYSLDRVLNPATESPWRTWLGPTEEVKIVDDKTVQVILKEPFPGLLGGLAGMRASGIMPAGLAESENLKIKGIGTGPFKLVEYVPQDHVTYARHGDYWDKNAPMVDNLVFKVMLDEAARMAALQSGQVQFASLTAQGAEQMKGVGTIDIMFGPSSTVVLTYINVEKPPLNDWRVRKALRMSIDTEEVIQKAVLGQGQPSGPIPTGYGEWSLDPKTLPYLKPDLEGAKKLLADAGYPDGKGATFTIKCSPQYPAFVTNALVMQESFKRVGVEVDVQQMEWGQFVKDYQTKTFEMANSGNSFRPDPDGYISAYFHSKGNLNTGGYKNDKLEPMIERARSISDAAQRKELYHEIQKILLEESPNFWYYTAFNIEAVSKKLKGYQQSFTQRRYFLKNAWLE